MLDKERLDRGLALRVLLVDDEPILLRVTARQLRAAGFTVSECANGAEAAALIGKETFDVVLSDIDMPGLSGVEMLKLLRQRQVDIPVVLMTGDPKLETAMKAVEHGAFKYLTKPVEPAELVETVRRAATTSHGRGSRPSLTDNRGLDPRTTLTRLEPGVVLADRYRLVRLLGEGGMGQVWEAVQLSTARSVAIKLLHSSLSSKARSEMRARMLREARAASSVAHPNVVDVFDLFELGDGTPVLVMALLRGHTLWHRLEQAKGMTLGDAADLLLPVVSAVGTAHAIGVIHRDLKPDNIFLADEGGRTTVKVLDFGIAKLVLGSGDEGGALTAAGTPIGTPGYMAPEQALGERDVDQRADVWSLGAILYEMLSGQRAVKANSLGQMIKLLLTSAVVPLAQQVPTLSPSVAALVDRMLARERDLRPGDLREVYAELARYARVVTPAFGPPAHREVSTTPDAPQQTESIENAPTELSSKPGTREPAD
jgi:eukaryotic-like serine/threonine-protein kinase